MDGTIIQCEENQDDSIHLPIFTDRKALNSSIKRTSDLPPTDELASGVDADLGGDNGNTEVGLGPSNSFKPSGDSDGAHNGDIRTPVDPPIRETGNADSAIEGQLYLAGKDVGVAQRDVCNDNSNPDLAERIDMGNMEFEPTGYTTEVLRNVYESDSESPPIVQIQRIKRKQVHWNDQLEYTVEEI
ncbi:hypothetical protein OCU04_008665 [Sclerotinia nivalis]|uniref:Uncharacterized protein n=1 Tax=Sclerotinia nivalis TaxID=352851 RepID=A0A9X0A8X7_9HELO|nr:hypothetical protein OCU04_013255 [Sclerotinia nivalis]KAJ8063449.1 hypothetical protein OCU04_008665 [Sclerotinia nivalis]